MNPDTQGTIKTYRIKNYIEKTHHFNKQKPQQNNKTHKIARQI
jgi:hypothetical protein